MITLYGSPISNYYNKVKLALLEKDIDFNEVSQGPNQSPELKKVSPVGKIPYIQTDEGYISESQAILEYLEDAFPEKPLYPADPFQCAKCREFIFQLELNMELIARRLYPEAIFGGNVSQEIKDEVLVKVVNGLKGLASLMSGSSYIMGDQFTAADVAAWPSFQLVSFATPKIYGRDLVAENIPDLESYMKAVESRPHVKKVAQDRLVAVEAFFAKQ